jgi:hypothetical protein
MDKEMREPCRERMSGAKTPDTFALYSNFKLWVFTFIELKDASLFRQL